MISRKVSPCVCSRMTSILATNAPKLAPALPGTALTASCKAQPMPRAASCNCSRLRAPMPRGGKFTTRMKLVSSRGFSSKRKYANACLISARSKKRKPPYTRYGMPALNKAVSITRLCALLRYSTAISWRCGTPWLPSPFWPSRNRCFISSTIHCASAKSVGDSYTRTGSPSPWVVCKFLPKRFLLWPIKWLALSKILLKLR